MSEGRDKPQPGETFGEWLNRQFKEEADAREKAIFNDAFDGLTFRPITIQYHQTATTTGTGEVAAMPDPNRILKNALACDNPDDLDTHLTKLAELGQCPQLVSYGKMTAMKRWQAEAEKGELERRLEQIAQPPLSITTYIRHVGGSKVECASAGCNTINEVVEGNIDQWRPGTRLLVTADGFVVGATEDSPFGTAQGFVAEVAPFYALVETPGDSHGKVVCAYDQDMKPPLKVGDEVMLSLSPPVVLSHLSQKKDTKYLLEDAPDVTFRQIGGHDTVTGEIVRDLELHLMHAEKLAAFDLRPVSGITLHGKPGTGKTMMAKALANHLSRKYKGTRFLSVDPGILRGWLYGQTEHNIRELFEAARSCEGYCVMFFDELDNFGTRSDSTESGIDSRVLGTLLSELDGLRSAKNKILVVGATNRLDLCDGALVRQGRFGDRVYEVPRPDHDATQAILRLYLRKGLPFSGCNQAECTKAISRRFFSAEKPVLRVTTHKDEKFDVSPETIISGALLEAIVQNAKRSAADRFVRDEKPAGITVDDCEVAADAAIHAEAEKLAEPHAARQALGAFQGQQIVAVETL